MTALPLVIYPDPRLKMKSEPVTEVTDEIRKLMDDMLDTMYASAGIGLAAIQVGVPKCIVVMNIGYGATRYGKIEGANMPLYLVNPEIIEQSDEQNSFQEGCLSFPGQYADVTRPKRVKVKYLDYHGKQQTLDADGVLATCVQHEMDHLDGVVFVDYLSRTKRDMIERKLRKQSGA